MSALYEIDNAILECIDDETGEIIDGKRLSELQIERDKKIESVALWYKNLISDAEQYKREKQLFADKEQKAKSKAESLKQWLDNALLGSPFKADSGRVSISYRKSESIVVDSLNDIPDEYLKYSEPTVDKIGLKRAIKEGQNITGAHIETNTNINIK